MKTLFIISIILFYISYGTTFVSEKKSSFTQDMSIHKVLSTLLCHIIPVISLCHIFVISWYWLAIINFVICLIVPYPIALIYCAIFGIKTRSQFSYETEELGRHHLYEYDGLLTLAVAIILFVIAYFV